MVYSCVTIASDQGPDKEVYLKTDELLPQLILDEAGNITMGYGTSRPSYKYVYRKMGMEEYKAAINSQKLPSALGKHTATSEKWVSESLQHSRAFDNKAVRGAPQVVTEIGLDPSGYAQVREHSIPQRKAKALQPKDGRPFNVINKERLETHPRGKVNLGIKGQQNLDEFNKSVVKIRKVNEHGFMNKNKLLRWIRRNKLAAVSSLLSVAIDVASVTLSVVEDHGKFGPSTTITLAEISGGIAGSALGAALFSFIPVLGTIVGGLIGTIIGNLLGQGISHLIFAIRSVAPGPGAPLLDTEPDPYGPPKLGQATEDRGAPSLGLRTGASGALSIGHKVPHGAPKMNFSTRR